ncbi:uncharacterized protein LOC126573173 [Anopheles aquasalis]|uniref:uncharacterized protein LOC126573173 n=1 Tax=Anopheles aquasalis TaxID=42839 RepID=UPI00215B378E|nr:uncharacterized protein LOC126573173 [Anopheles aquasalis]
MASTGSYHPATGQGAAWWALVWNGCVVVLLLLQLVKITGGHVPQESDLPDDGAKYEHLYNGSQSVYLDADLITVSRFDDDDDDDDGGHRRLAVDDDGMQGDEPGLPFTEHSYQHHHHSYHRQQQQQQQQHEPHHKLSCQACQYRNVYAKASLKSIKAHFLMKLGIERTPNGTAYPEVPDAIMERYQDSLRLSNAPVGQKESYDYQSDEPYGGGGMQADEPDEQDDDYDYYQITNKIFILPNQGMYPANPSEISC